MRERSLPPAKAGPPAGDPWTLPADLPTGTVTFLFTDVEGSTRLVQRLGDRYSEVLAEHQRLVRDALAAHGGREVDTQGDAFFAVFARAKDAVAAALALQRTHDRHRWPHGAGVSVRVGMHTGEPSVAGNRYVGLGVHRAARISAAGHGGQVLLSQASYAVLVDEVLPDIRLRDLGEHRLKDLERPERIYQLVVPDLPSQFPPLKTLGEVTEAEEPSDVRRGARSPGIDVVVAEDSVLLREGLCRLLEEAGFRVVAKVGDAVELVRQVAALRPAVAITDIKMPPNHADEGLVAAEQIRSSYPDVGVLVLSQYLESRYAMRLLESYPERVGYLLKDRISDVAVLGDAIRRIAEGECVLDPTIVSRMMARARRQGPLAELDDGEQDLLALIAEGRSDEAIAELLDLDPGAVEGATQAIFGKLDLTGTGDDLRRMVAVLGVLRA